MYNLKRVVYPIEEKWAVDDMAKVKSGTPSLLRSSVVNVGP